MRTDSILVTSSIAFVLAILPLPAVAQQKSPVSAAAPVSREIRAAVDRMANALKAQQSFELKAEVTTEEVLFNGQKVQSTAELTIGARRPDRLFIDVASERRSRRFFYDGATVTVFGPAKNFYASAPAPATIAAMLKEVAGRYGVDTPLADIFEWGSSGVHLERIRSAINAGPDRIMGEICDQYAFRQEGVDWQLWIAQADPALPCKLVIVDTVDSSHPQFSAIFAWHANVQIADETFRFAPPAGAQRVALGEVQALQHKAASK